MSSISSKPLDQLTASDLQALVANREREGTGLEFKRGLPGGTNDDKKEFLADVASFANASGGDLIYGIAEVGGEADAIVPVATTDVDADLLRLDSIIRSGIDPRIPGLRIHTIDVDGGAVFIIRIPRSWAAPHLVSFANSSRFYSRTSAGKYQLDVRELRALFVLSESIEQRVRAFRDERLGRLIAGDVSFKFYSETKLVIHIIPLLPRHHTGSVDVSKIAANPGLIRPLSSSGMDYRYNLDGFMTIFRNEAGNVLAYTQLLRDGTIEAVDTLMVAAREPDHGLPITYIEDRIIEVLPQFLSAESVLGIAGPVVLMIALIGVKGRGIAVSNTILPMGERSFDRDVVIVPEIVVEDVSSVDAPAILQPLFDAIWNAAGWPACMNYDAEGRRKSQ